MNSTPRLPWLTLGVVALISLLFYLLNRFQPLAADDFCYCFIWGTEERVATLRDILTSQCTHWLELNGRFVAHSLAQFFLMLDKWVFDIANTLVLLGVALGITHLTASREHSGKGTVFALILSLFVLLVPAGNATLIWLDGACNYLWPTLLVTTFLLLLLSSDHRLHALALLLAPIAGNSQEGISIGLVSFLAAYTVLDAARRRTVSPLLVAGLLLCAAGVSLNIFAPSTATKMAAVSGIGSGGQASPLGLIVSGAAWCVKSLAAEHVYADASLYPVFLMLAFCGATLVRRRQQGLTRENTLVICLLAATIVQASAILYAGALGSRPWIGVFYFSFLAALVYLIPMAQRASQRQQVVVLLLVASAPVALMLRALPPAYTNREHYRAIEQQILGGERLIVKPAAWSSTNTTRRYWAGSSLAPNCFFYVNDATARYYKARPLSLISEETYKKLKLIPADAIRRAASGQPVLLPNGELFLILPAETCGVILSPDAHSGLGSEPNLVWPMEAGYGLLHPVPPGTPGLHIRAKLTSGTQQDIHLSADQLDALRQEPHS